jgi:inner membrane protein
MHLRYVQLLAARYKHAKFVSVLPTFRFNRWNAIAETDSELVLGEWKGNRYLETERLSKHTYNDMEQTPELPDQESLKRISPAADTFFSIARHIRHERIVTEETIRCIWTDLRFRFGNYYLFKTILEFDREGNLLSDFLAWRGNRNRTRQNYESVEA